RLQRSITPLDGSPTANIYKAGIPRNGLTIARRADSTTAHNQLGWSERQQRAESVFFAPAVKVVWLKGWNLVRSEAS
ncbi:MAG: hypothetical protein PVF85_09135, partial [Anaerolineales bacterium]